jgi:hypothetical protein
VAGAFDALRLLVTPLNVVQQAIGQAPTLPTFPTV